jgi:hypothetical protein
MVFHGLHCKIDFTGPQVILWRVKGYKRAREVLSKGD